MSEYESRVLSPVAVRPRTPPGVGDPAAGERLIGTTRELRFGALETERRLPPDRNAYPPSPPSWP